MELGSFLLVESRFQLRLFMVLAASDDFAHLNLDDLKVLEGSSVNKRVLIAPLPQLERFEEKRPF